MPVKEREMARQAAYQRIAEVTNGLTGLIEADAPRIDDAFTLAFYQVEATLAVAQATIELAGELDAIRTQIANLA